MQHIVYWAPKSRCGGLKPSCTGPGSNSWVHPITRA